MFSSTPAMTESAIEPQRLRRQKPASSFDPIYEAGDLLGDAWSWMILREAIFNGTSRFSEFEDRLAISPKILSARLATLSARGLFEKLQLPGRGGPIEYRLTDMGKDFVGCLAAAMRFGQSWQGRKRGPQVRIVHRTCGQPLLPEYRCAECGDRLDARGVGVVSIRRGTSELLKRNRQRMPALDCIDKTGSCPIAFALKVVGDRWSSLVIRECFLGTRRFGEFEQHLGIASNILSNRLDRLVRLGVLAAMPAHDQPSRLVYRLTPKGHDLYYVPLSMLTWAERWLVRGPHGTKLIHKRCQRPLKAIFSCGSCGTPALFQDLAFESPRSRQH